MVYFRKGTWDPTIWNDIVEKNEYAIHNEWPHNVIDIGGHIGSFSYKMLEKHNTKKVITIEPNIDNFNILVQNLQKFIIQNKVIALNKGIGPKDTKININSPLGQNTGGSFYAASLDGVETISLDSLIEIIDDGSPILLKLDCEGCEYEALACCSNLQKINCIVGEFHIRDNFNVDNIKNILKDYKFDYHYRSNNLGLFGAHRP